MRNTIFSLFLIIFSQYLSAQNFINLQNDFTKANYLLTSYDIYFTYIFDFDYDSIKIAKSIVFPEIVRYNTIMDIGEIYANIYTKNLPTSFDFSISPLQMKPSFIHKIDKFCNDFNIDKNYTCPQYLGSLTAHTDISKYINYLRLYIIILEKLNPSLLLANDNDKIRVMSTAYNYGLFQIKSNLTLESNEKYWNLPFSSQKYSYSSISKYYFLNY